MSADLKVVSATAASPTPAGPVALPPARDALRASIRDLAVARDAPDRAEEPCHALQALIAARDRTARQLPDAKDEDQAALGNWFAAPDGYRPELPSIATRTRHPFGAGARERRGMYSRQRRSRFPGVIDGCSQG